MLRNERGKVNAAEAETGCEEETRRPFAALVVSAAMLRKPSALWAKVPGARLDRLRRPCDRGRRLKPVLKWSDFRTEDFAKRQAVPDDGHRSVRHRAVSAIDVEAGENGA